MISAINKFKIILSDKKVSIAIIALAIVARIIQLIFFYNIRVDGMYQVMAMQNFVDGHGISTAKVLPADLSTIIYDPLINWPPGYSLLLSPFYILFGHNYIVAGITVDILAAVLLIFICRRILKALDIPLYMINLFTLLTGFFIYFFYFINSSDAAAITFFLTAVYFTLLLLKRESFSPKLTAGIIVFLFFSGLIKYLFIPVIFIIPVFLFLKGLADKNKGIRKAGLISFGILFIFFTGIFVWQKMISGSVGYISEPVRGFFPENLLVAHPSIPSSFINPDTISKIFPAGSNISRLIFHLLQCVNLLIFVTAFIYILKRVIKNSFKKLTTIDSFFYLAFFLSAGITLVLTLLSLRVGKEENIPGHWWTYVEEPRYYGLINVLVQLCVFILYQCYQLKRSKRLKLIFISLLLLLLPETFRGILFTVRRVMHINTEEYSWQSEENIQFYGGAIIRKEKLPEENVAVTGSSYYIYYRVGIYNHVPVLTELSSINDVSKLNTKKPVLLVVILQEDDFPKYGHFLASPEKKFAGYFRGFYFYTAHINPH